MTIHAFIGRMSRDDPGARPQPCGRADHARKRRGADIFSPILFWNRGAVRIADFVTNSIPCPVTLAR